jgi:S-adenosylmethionine:tRNA ribosyltransferase-isomerase
VNPSFNQPGDYAYHLPDELIAKHPLPERSASRLLVLHRAENRFEDRHFRELPSFLAPGDCVVLNNTKVIPARLYGRRPGHTGKIEILLTRRLATANHWEALVRPGRKLPPGAEVEFSEGLGARILLSHPAGLREVELIPSPGYDVDTELDRIGHVPLPPYLQRPDSAADRERYQTVFARHAGSAAAPTAGLHFTPEILAQCRTAGAQLAEVTLHVGLGTFQPLSAENLQTSTLHHEHYELSPEAATTINAARRRLAVGTTSVRTLESAALRGTPLAAQAGDTQLFIRPGFPFQLVDLLLTNFHLPESSLMMLVAAFAGYDLTMRAYRHAVAERYRFFSYGDAMLIL